ncbi:DUF1616 domain-containing protein [Haladaptatus paucihalophilus]|uniref:Uncharacterized membrane protein n=2 Tax=Haladaptatus paucihalophilus DX253 TaxID=797209 RepID=A0A1M7CB04_HALPU|nr:DUF1616 domain-containing protein [Haladaptatus paucihalophilus]SHL64458.1 Uncharacterized membrane protein [Haladaptatus paucihalophilus DX253]
MSTNSRWWFLDLVLALMLTAVGGVAAYVELGGRVRVALVLPLVVFLPGYVLISALFPEGSEGETRTFGSGNDDAAYAVGGPERVALAAALSVAVVPMIAALSNFTPWGVRVHPILYGIVGFTAIFGVIAFIRRLRVPAERRYSPGVPGLLFNPSGRSGSGVTVALNVGIVIAFLLLASSVGFAVLNPPQGKAFTEFYVSNTNDVNSKTNTMYDTDLAADGVTVSVHNHERERTEYTVVAVIQQVDGGEVTKQSQFAKEQVTVDAGEKKQVKLTGDPAFTGENVRVQLLLYKGSASGEPYMKARAWVSSRSGLSEQTDTGSDTQKSDSGTSSDGGDDQQTTEQQQTTQRQTTEQQRTTQQQTTRRQTTQQQTTSTSSQPPSTTTTTTSTGTTTTGTTTTTTTTTTTDDGGFFS